MTAFLAAANDTRLLGDGSVTTPRGFRAGAVQAGIKPSGKLDLGLLASDRPCTAAGMFTQSTVPGAPVLVSKEHLRAGRAQAIIVNAGIANVATGEQGLADAREMARLAAESLGVQPAQVLVASTGVIGHRLPMERVRDGIQRIELASDAGLLLAEAIMTTDTVRKSTACRFQAGGRHYTVGGIAKGSGMIHPDMATMFSFLTTDAPVEAAFLDRSLHAAVADSFNMISVDMDTSTSDTVLLLANGAGGGPELGEGTDGAEAFQEALHLLSKTLARMLAADGEGATKLIEVRITNAANQDEARRAARTISSSPLMKSAVYGNDPNWGRMMMAIGRSGAHIDLTKARLTIGEVPVYAEGRPEPLDGPRLKAALGGPEVILGADLASGTAAATAWGCDLTEEYVRINSEYTT
ncbi:MAG: bifunctional glutamate N-acetyltransferase/amino-acid acetyltransferase ArgJ [Dehalococcoidia bacterium]